MALWHLASRINTRLLLWRTSPSAFWVVQYDAPTEILTNYDYFLFDKKYEVVLQQLTGQVEICPVTVADGVRHLVWNNYVEVRILREADSHTITSHAFHSLEMYRSGEEYIFVSESLKEVLQKLSPAALHFSSGFSTFAA